MHTESERLAETLRTLRSYLPDAEEQQQQRDRVLAALADLEAPFERRAAPAHLTGSAIVAGPEGTLLHLHRRERRWLQPGGHIDTGELPWEAALRETREETGVQAHCPDDDPVLISVDTHTTAQSHIHHDLRFLLLSDGGEPAPAAGESPEVRWFGWDEAIELVAADRPLQRSLIAARDHLGRR